MKNLLMDIYSQAYNQSDDADGILIRNEEYFRNQGKIMQVEQCLQNLKKISVSYTNQTNDKSLEDEVKKCEQHWESTVHRVEHFRQQLQRIPAKWDSYREKFREMEKWMDHVDKTMDSIVREVDSAEAFEREKTIFQVILFILLINQLFLPLDINFIKGWIHHDRYNR